LAQKRVRVLLLSGMTIDTNTLTIKKVHNALASGDFSAKELTDAYLKRIEEKNGDLNAYLETFDDAKEQADVIDVRISKKEDISILNGIPLAIKDNILIQGKNASCSSKILESYIASYDATVIEKLKGAGVVFMGRTNMDEFAMGSSTEHSAFGPTKNPHDTECSPGGSSGGSAASVAFGGALVALGSDTGGSIRQPASFCGVVGLKPTYGAVSRYGLIAMASSLDQIGPITKTVEDSRIVFEAISGHDPKDSTSLPNETRNKKQETIKTIGVPRHLIERDGIDAEVLDNFNSLMKKMEEEGLKIKEISLPRTEYALPIYYIIMPAESSANLARFDGVRYGLHKEGETLFEDYAKTRGEGFGEEVKRRIIMGTYVLSSGYYDAYYNKARSVRSLLRQDFAKVFDEVDVVATPTSPTPAFRLGEKTKDPLSMYLADVFTAPANIVGIPAISVPSGKTKSGLPIGMQFMAPHQREDLLFNIGIRLEQIVGTKS
jgi:aspartyl-tRNA(Asn)/glutamyl-tRNA(Gln) amidotransferase subunit A